jgi:hypothetical protein
LAAAATRARKTLDNLGPLLSAAGIDPKGGSLTETERAKLRNAVSERLQRLIVGD